MRDVVGIVREGELLRGRVAPFDVIEHLEELDIVAQRLRDAADAADVLRCAPSGVMPATIGVGDERDAHGAPRRRREAISATIAARMTARSHHGKPCGTTEADAAVVTGGPSAAMS